jgi:hypothetical protein
VQRGLNDRHLWRVFASLIERFDREKTDGGWTRKVMVSALTLFALDDRALGQRV